MIKRADVLGLVEKGGGSWPPMEAHVFTSTLEFQAQSYEKTRTLASIRAKKLYNLCKLGKAASWVYFDYREINFELT